MKLVARNIAQGGLGTMQDALGSRSLYGEEMDIMIWDSSMTEKDGASYDLFARQALLGNRAPVLYHGNWGVQKQLNQETGADIFYMGNGMVGIPTTMDEKQVLDLPWATRYMICDKQRADLCNAATKYRTKCWVDRPGKNSMFIKRVMCSSFFNLLSLSLFTRFYPGNKTRPPCWISGKTFYRLLMNIIIFRTASNCGALTGQLASWIPNSSINWPVDIICCFGCFGKSFEYLV